MNLRLIGDICLTIHTKPFVHLIWNVALTALIQTTRNLGNYQNKLSES